MDKASVKRYKPKIIQNQVTYGNFQLCKYKNLINHRTEFQFLIIFHTKCFRHISNHRDLELIKVNLYLLID